MTAPDIREMLEATYPDRWALALIAVEPYGKKPLRTDWTGEARGRWRNGANRSAHIERAVRWVAQGGNLGLALPVGAIALDADTQEAAAWLERALPDAPMQTTARGCHVVVRASNGTKINATVGVELLEGVRIDVRVGGKSQIIVAPSIHQSGHRYAWKRELPANVSDLPECPPLILSKITAPPAQQSASIDGTRHIPEGQRNDSLARIAGRLRRDGLEPLELEAALAEINVQRCQPPLPKSEVKQIAQSIGGYPLEARGGQAGATGAGGTEAELRRRERRGTLTAFSTIQAKSTEWLWGGRIPRGAVSLIDGDPDLGKSTMSYDLAARVSTGTWMPDGGDGIEGDVIVVSYEDDPERTIRPRLDAARADVARVHWLTIASDHGAEMPILPPDLAELERLVVETGSVLVTFDPLIAALDGSVDSHRDQDVRRVLSALARVAERTRAAFVGIRHVTKRPGANPLHAGGGSIGIIGAARSALLVGKDPQDPELRVLARLKCNLAAPVPSLGFRLVAAGGTVAVDWLGEVSTSAGELLEAAGLTPEVQSERVEAREWLRDNLADGPRQATEIRRDAQAAGIASRTLDRAKAELGVKSLKAGLRGGWSWHLPPKDAKTA